MSLIQDALRGGERCPAVEDLDRYRECEPRERGWPDAAHLACCPTCRTEAELLDGFYRGEIRGDEAPAVWWIRHRVSESYAKDFRRNRFRLAVSAWLKMLREPVLIGGACVLAMVAMVIHEGPVSGPPAVHVPEELGATLRSAQRIVGLSAVGQLHERAREFRWAPIPSADHYTFEARDVAGELVWEAETREPFVRVLDWAGRRPGERGVIRWRVEARGISGNLLAQSEQVEMRVIR